LRLTNTKYLAQHLGYASIAVGSDLLRNSTQQRTAAAGDRKSQSWLLTFRQKISQLIVVDLHQLNRDFQFHPTGGQRGCLTLQFNGCPMRQIRHGVGLSTASGAISQDAHGLSSHGRIQLILNGGENLIIRGLRVEKVVEEENS